MPDGLIHCCYIICKSADSDLPFIEDVAVQLWFGVHYDTVLLLLSYKLIPNNFNKDEMKHNFRARGPMNTFPS